LGEHKKESTQNGLGGQKHKTLHRDLIRKFVSGDENSVEGEK